MQIARGLAAAHEQRHRPSRSEAGERLRHERRAGQDPRLRARQAHRGDARASRPSMHWRRPPARHDAGDRAGHGRLHGAGTGARASRPTTAPTSSPSARSSTRCCRAGARSPAPTPADTMTAILKEDPPDLPASGPHVPPALARIVDRCLEKNPASRFQSAGDSGVRAGIAVDIVAAELPRSPAVLQGGCASAIAWSLVALLAIAAATLGFAGGFAAAVPGGAGLQLDDSAAGGLVHRQCAWERAAHAPRPLAGRPPPCVRRGHGG